MATVFRKIWQYLAGITNIWERFEFLSQYKFGIFMCVFLLALLLGFYLYRLFFSVVFFYLFVTLSVFVLAPRTSWQNTVAFFSVVGVMLSFLSYKMTKSGGVILCSVVGGMLGYMIVPSVIAVIVGVVIAGALTIIFPVISICVFMALFGGMGIGEIANLPVFVTILIVIAGAALQLFLSRNTALFDRKCPDKLRYYLEQRKKNANEKRLSK